MRLLSETRNGRHSLYLYDEGSYDPLARVDGQGEHARLRYYHTDPNGLPQQLTEEDGRCIWQARYQVWGNTLAEQQESFFVEEQNLRFQGQYLDRETGLHYNTFRFYDPDIGRFISPDPIGLAGGINLFQYAPEPYGWVDPWGLKTWTYQNMKSLEGFQKHHIIPQSLENHPALKNADFKMHSNRNIIYLPTNETAHPTRTIHKGSHPGYNKSVRQQLDIIARVGEKNGWVEADYKKAVSGVLRNERAGLRNGRTMLNKNSIRAVRCGG